MKRPKISSVDRVHQRISRETLNSEKIKRKKAHQRPTHPYMAKKSNWKSSQILEMTGE
jgi:hypothetical protein